MQVASIPMRKLGNLSTSIKEPMDLHEKLFWPGVVHFGPKRYVREAKRSLETRLKEHRADINNKRFHKCARTQHVFDPIIDWIWKMQKFWTLKQTFW